MGALPRWLVVCGLLGMFASAGCRQILGFDDPVAADAEPGPTDDDGWRSGTRLRLMWNDYAGAREYTGLYDTALDAACTPMSWTDGKRYCLPSVAGSIVFSEATCTQVMGLWLAGSGTCPRPPPPYFQKIALTTCGTDVPRSMLRRAGALLDPQPTSYYYVDADGNCASGNALASYDFYALGDDLTPADLVELTEEDVAMGRLVRRDHVGADGARMPASIYDSTLETTCTVDATNRCAPVVTTTGAYLDGACSQALAAGPSACPAPRYGARARRPNCPDPGLDYFTVGTKTSNTTLYHYGYGTSASTCMSFDASADYDYFALDQQVSPVTLARTVDDAPGDQVHVVHVTDGMARLRGGMQDVTNNLPCAGSTSTMRCTPSLPSVSTYYTDAACTVIKKVALVYSGNDTCGQPQLPPFVLEATTQTGQCTSTYAMYRLGARFTGTLYAKSVDACTAASFTGSQRYEVGVAVPLETLAPFTPMIDR